MEHAFDYLIEKHDSLGFSFRSILYFKKIEMSELTHNLLRTALLVHEDVAGDVGDIAIYAGEIFSVFFIQRCYRSHGIPDLPASFRLVWDCELRFL